MTTATAAIGIDLGTTFSLVAHLDDNGKPVSIPNSEGDLLTPSVVLFEGSSIIVGKEAVKAGTMVPDSIAQFAKRDMGSSVYSKTINGEHLPPEVIQSFILEKLKRDAESKLGPITKAVITVPAYFNEPRRKATQDAGQLAGLEVLDIINEPTAAAIAFGVQQGFLNQRGESSRSEKVLVYDLGGGTFDVTLMEIDGKNYNVIATAGDVMLGGIDWDRRIVNHVAEEFKNKHGGIDPRENPTGFQRLLREAEDAKRALSAREATTITFDYQGNALRVPISRRQFETMTSDLLERTRFTTKNLLKEGGCTFETISRLLLVGGSSRMPMVQTMLEQESGKKVDRSLALDEAVAHGAAIYAGLVLAFQGGAKPEVKIQNVNSHSLGILGIEPDTGRPRNGVMIPKNTKLPASKTAKFKTHKDNQPDVVVKVIEGGDASGNNSTAIGKCVIEDLPNGLPAGTPVEVTFFYAENGRLTVKAGVQGHEASLTIARASGLSDAKLQEWSNRIKNQMRPIGQDDSSTSSTTPDQQEVNLSLPSSLPAKSKAGPPPLPSTRPGQTNPAKSGPPPLPGSRKTTGGPPPIPSKPKSSVPPPLPKSGFRPPPLPAKGGSVSLDDDEITLEDDE